MFLSLRGQGGGDFITISGSVMIRPQSESVRLLESPANVWLDASLKVVRLRKRWPWKLAMNRFSGSMAARMPTR